jgi:hypothetical protein
MLEAWFRQGPLREAEAATQPLARRRLQPIRRRARHHCGLHADFLGQSQLLQGNLVDHDTVRPDPRADRLMDLAGETIAV